MKSPISGELYVIKYEAVVDKPNNTTEKIQDYALARYNLSDGTWHNINVWYHNLYRYSGCTVRVLDVVSHVTVDNTGVLQTAKVSLYDFNRGDYVRVKLHSGNYGYGLAVANFNLKCRNLHLKGSDVVIQGISNDCIDGTFRVYATGISDLNIEHAPKPETVSDK